jgi:endoglucanase
MAAAGFGAAYSDLGSNPAQGPGPAAARASGAERVEMQPGNPVDPSPAAYPLLPRPVMTAEDHAEWEAFKRRFVTPEGRVVDTGNNGNSHSEGQGWGMLFAESFDDRQSFDRILDWTAANLRRRGDSLHAWRYQPGLSNPVPDTNNATDGDLFIATALARAALRWGRPDFAQVASAIGRDVLGLLVREIDGRLVLLPGAQGFEQRGGIVVNPSYYAFAVLPYLEAVAPSQAWQRVRADGLSLIQQGRFGAWALPPDWLLVPRDGGPLLPAPAWPARFSYDAIRVPLHLAWSGLPAPDVHRAFRSYWVATGSVAPAWIDLKSGAVAPYPASAGMVAVSKLVTSRPDLALPDGFPTVRTATDYYSAALIVLSRIAWKESRLA